MTQINTREEYKKILGDRKFIGRDGCPFCSLEEQESMILWRGKYWFIIENKYPYTGTKDHIMAVPYEHHIHASEFSPEVWAEMEHVHAWVRDFYDKEEYFSFTRESISIDKPDTRSIEHYHTHFCPGVLYGDTMRNMLKSQGFPVE